MLPYPLGGDARKKVDEEFLILLGVGKVVVIQPHQQSELSVCQCLLLPEKLKSNLSWTEKTHQSSV